VVKTVIIRDKVEIIKILLKKEDKILIKAIREAIEETIKNNEMMITTLNKNQIKRIKETKENNKVVKIIKGSLMKSSQKIINKIQTVISEVENSINRGQKIMHKMEQ
jgi:hypothetical protein